MLARTFMGWGDPSDGHDCSFCARRLASSAPARWGASHGMLSAFLVRPIGSDHPNKITQTQNLSDFMAITSRFVSRGTGRPLASFSAGCRARQDAPLRGHRRCGSPQERAWGPRIGLPKTGGRGAALRALWPRPDRCPWTLQKSGNWPADGYPRSMHDAVPSPASPAEADAFVRRWAASGAAERANYQLFLAELCDVLGVPRPEPTRADDPDNAYVFERPSPSDHGDGTTTTGRIDLYKRGCFVLEAKQGSGRRERPSGADLPHRRPAPAGDGRPGHRGLGRRDDQGPTAGRAVRPRPAGRRGQPALPDRGRHRPHHRALRRLLPPGPDLRPLPRPRSPPHLPRRPGRGGRSASASAPSGPTPSPSTPPASAARSRARSPRGWPSWRKRLEAAGHDPQRRRPLPHALPVHLLRRGRRPAPRGRPSPSCSGACASRRGLALPRHGPGASGRTWTAGGFSPVL